jgi:ABC-2 type transport system ATP-binding protein
MRADPARHSAADTSPAIQINEVFKTYPVPFARARRLFGMRTRAPVEAVRGVSFAVRRGEIFGLIGRNGAGKTTLTKILATLVQPTSGTVTICGYDSVRHAGAVRAQIGLATAEERSFYWRLTVEQNLLFFARLYGLGGRAGKSRIAELLDLLQLADVRLRRFGELSTGNKQRVAIARALLNSPPVLLLDEPTRSLDPFAAARLRDMVASLARGPRAVTILLTSHNLAEVEELCARVAIISRGQIRAVDTPHQLREAHRQHERVHLTCRGLTAEAAIALLAPRLGGVEAGERVGGLTVTFTRQIGDDALHEATRALLQAGARIVACETERGTLFDVLATFERENEEAPAGTAADRR